KNTDQSRSILGAFMISDVEHFYAGDQYNMELIVFNPSDDSEWIKDIHIVFPGNVGLLSTSDFVGGTGGDLVYTGTTGYGVDATWHGEDGSGWGVLKGGETAVATISFLAMESMTADLSLYFEIWGDIYGNEPHIVSGMIESRNLGVNQQWLSINNTEGVLAGNSDEELIIEINTAGMPDGNYFGEIIISEQFQEERIIPVNLTVDQFMEIDDNKIVPQLEIYPNPFTKHTNITWNNTDGLETYISIHDLHGRIINSYSSNQQGINTWLWNGKNVSGSTIEQGIYFVWIRNANLNERKKIIYLR
ncbi:T9SS type A sorting domain-containing protein, partial [Bacteroidota bacterium]